MRIRVGAGNMDATFSDDKALADAYSNRFYIPLDVELPEIHMPSIRAPWETALSMNSPLTTTTA